MPLSSWCLAAVSAERTSRSMRANRREPNCRIGFHHRTLAERVPRRRSARSARAGSPRTPARRGWCRPRRPAPRPAAAPPYLDALADAHRRQIGDVGRDHVHRHPPGQRRALLADQHRRAARETAQQAIAVARGDDRQARGPLRRARRRRSRRARQRHLAHARSPCSRASSPACSPNCAPRRAGERRQP